MFDLAEDAAARVAADIGGVACVCDVASGESVEAAVAKAKEAHGAARIVVQCAGVAPPAKIVGKKGPHSLDMYAKVVGINLVGTFNVMRLAAADMLALEPIGDNAERGVIINTASIAAFEGQVGQAAYASSKAGVVGLTLPAAREFAFRRHSCLCIAPGIFATPMMAGLPEETQKSLGKRGALPVPARQPAGIRQAGTGDHRQPLPQWRSHPRRRRPTDDGLSAPMDWVSRLGCAAALASLRRQRP